MHSEYCTHRKYTVKVFLCGDCEFQSRMYGLSGATGMYDVLNSFAGKANYYGKHVVQNKSVACLQENIVSKQLALYDQETTDQYVVDCKVLTV